MIPIGECMNREQTEEFLKGKPSYCCRFHPTDWFHEVGCPHMEWTKEQLQGALDSSKRSNELLRKEYLGHNV